MTSKALCEPCSERKTSAEAFKWCCDCEESLCKTCAEFHLSMKASKHHHLIDIVIAHSFPSKPLSGIKFCEKHENFDFEYFCKDHQQLCCHECLTSEIHRSCKLTTIDAASKHVKTSYLFKDVETEVNHILETLTNIATDRKKNVEAIDSSVEMTKNSIARLKVNIMHHMNTLETKVLEDLDRIKKDTEVNLEDEKAQAQTEREVVHVYQNQIRFMKQHGSNRQTFLFIHKLRAALHELKDQLIAKVARMRSVSIEHNIPADLVESLTLGSVITKKLPCADKFKLHIDDYKLYRKFKLCGKVDMTTVDKQAFISGIALTNDKLLLCNCDWNHHMPKVLVCDKNGEFIANIEMNGAPWDIAVLPGTEKAVVVLPNTNSIQFIDLSRNGPGKEIKLPGSDEKRGIAASEDRIFVGGMDRFIYVLDFNGILLSTIFVSGEKFCYLLPLSNGDLIYSDFTSIHRIRRDGSEVYVFNSPDMKNPKKIATDQLGNLYIACKDSHDIHRLTPDGTSLDIILKAEDEIHHPRAICFDKTSNKLFISNHGGKELLIYHCTD